MSSLIDFVIIGKKFYYQSNNTGENENNKMFCKLNILKSSRCRKVYVNVKSQL